MRPYLVRQGDHLAQIAMAVGCPEDSIWEHPTNQPLRDRGRTRDILYPGDVVYVPEEREPGRRVALGAANTYQGNVPTVPLSVAFRGRGGRFANQRYTVRGGTPTSGTSGADGAVTFEVALTEREVTVEFPSLYEVFVVRVGAVDPLEETSGVAGRLQQMGYLSDGLTGDTDELAYALRRFQADEALDPTGECDERSRARLRERFGC